MNIKNNKNGFTLIEMLIVVVIISALLAYAIPNYRQYVLRSQRSEAQNALLLLAAHQERFYANNNRYGNATELNLAALYPSPTALNELNYTITMATSNTTYTITAAAYGGQTDDSACLTYSQDNLGQKLPVGGGCW